VRTSPLRPGRWLFTLVTATALAISAIYEFVEWWAAVLLGQGADAFLGTQGDPWDTQWDMFMAFLGAMLAQALPKPAEADAALPSARAILDRHVQAIGGREAILSHTSSHATGTLSVPSAGITGTLEVFAAAKPNRMLVKISLGGVGEVMEGFDGVNAWSMSPMTGAMVLQGKQLEDKKFDSEFYGELHEGSRYQSLKTLEKTTFDGRPCYKVSLVRPGGSEDFEFYDVATGLKAGSINTRETQMGSITTTSIEADYRKFGNVLQATTLRQSAMGNPAVFEPPAQIKALAK
jgi:hypothetical protein